ncbi:MAG: molybdopterin-guanine dinucleotide biosynthesis protein B [Rhodospirillales bacterium]
MKTFGLVGWSGSGKTTLMVKLLPELIGRGLSVSTMKHTHHDVDIDRPGKDSYEHRRAGAREVMLASGSRWSLVHELGAESEPDLDSLVARMTPVDLLLVEGFKRQGHDKIEIHRPVLGQEFLYLQDENIVAIASDAPVRDVSLPVLDLHDVSGIGEFIIKHCGLKAAGSHG